MNLTYRPIITFRTLTFETLIAETTVVMIPSGPTASRIWSAQPSDILRNCFVTCSPNSVRSGARSLPRLLMNSSPAKPEERVGVLSIGIAVGVPLAVEVVAVGAMTSATTEEEVTKDSRSMREPRWCLFPQSGEKRLGYFAKR